mgnify:CR=1 FL=1
MLPLVQLFGKIPRVRAYVRSKKRNSGLSRAFSNPGRKMLESDTNSRMNCENIDIPFLARCICPYLCQGLRSTWEIYCCDLLLDSSLDTHVKEVALRMRLSWRHQTEVFCLYLLVIPLWEARHNHDIMCSMMMSQSAKCTNPSVFCGFCSSEDEVMVNSQLPLVAQTVRKDSLVEAQSKLGIAFSDKRTFDSQDGHSIRTQLERN